MTTSLWKVVAKKGIKYGSAAFAGHEFGELFSNSQENKNLIDNSNKHLELLQKIENKFSSVDRNNVVVDNKNIYIFFFIIIALIILIIIGYFFKFILLNKKSKPINETARLEL